MPQTLEIKIRDPFVLPMAEERKYYLFGTTDHDCWGRSGVGFDCYRSEDLENWEGPFPAFRPPSGFWATHNFWAPEAHVYRGRYYLFASFKVDGRCRGTQILSADQPQGPYLPHSYGPVTPCEWECLDGTLFVDDAGLPWMVFCHEWVQVSDGGMYAVRLQEDLIAPIGEPIRLFNASEAPWSTGFLEFPDKRVTDGPFIYPTASGKLLMLWSTMGVKGYTMGYAISDSGKITGPWRQHPDPIFEKDGGHGMIFRTFEGDLMLSLHQPNETPNERAQFFPLRETPDGLLELELQVSR